MQGLQLKNAATLGQAGNSSMKHYNATATRKSKKSTKITPQGTPHNQSMAAGYLSIDKSQIAYVPATTDVGDTTFAELRLLQTKLAAEY